MEGKKLILKWYKGKLYLINEKIMCMYFIIKRFIKIYLVWMLLCLFDSGLFGIFDDW